MKKVFFVLLLLSLLIAALPASAQTHERIGPNILFYPDFPVGEPFHIILPWQAWVPDETIVGLVDVTLEVDGVYYDVSFIDRGMTLDPDGQPRPTFVWVFNFPDGMQRGITEFRFQVFLPCQMAVDNFYYFGTCEKHNALVETTFPALYVVNFYEYP